MADDDGRIAGSGLFLIGIEVDVGGDGDGIVEKRRVAYVDVAVVKDLIIVIHQDTFFLFLIKENLC